MSNSVYFRGVFEVLFSNSNNFGFEVLQIHLNKSISNEKEFRQSIFHGNYKS